METLLNNLVQATGWSILHSLWQSALIYGVLLLFQIKALHINAKIKYTLAYAASCLMFICFIFTFLTAFQLISNTAPTPNLLVGKVILPTALPVTLVQYTEMLFPYIVVGYSLGLIIQTIIVITGYRKVQALKHATYSAIPANWKLLFDSLISDLHIRKNIDFRLSEYVNVPLVIGFLKPVILFPVALAAQMDISQVEAILIHELSHVRRNDYFYNLIRTMIETVLFFNPFVRLTGNLINIEREHACDDLVVKITDTPLTYAHALLQLEILTDKCSPAFALAATGNNQHLYQRIKRITDMKTTYVNSKQKLLAVTLTIATIISLAWISPAKNNQDTTAKSKWDTQTSDLTPLDTGKKRGKKALKKKNEKVTEVACSTTMSPPLPAEPVVPPAPAGMIVPAAPVSVLAATIPPVPAAPQEPESNLAAPPAPPALDLSSAISNFAISVKEMTQAQCDGLNATEMKKMQADLEKQGAEMSKMFKSEREKAQWQKNNAQVRININEAKNKAQFEKLARETDARLNSKEYKAMFKNIEVQAKTASLQAQKMINSPEFRKNIERITVRANRPFIVITDNEDAQKVKETAEYQELKKKFEKDVQELVNKNQKKEQN